MAALTAIIDRMLNTLNSFVSSDRAPFGTCEELEGFIADPRGKLVKMEGATPRNTVMFSSVDTENYTTEEECSAAGGLWISPDILFPTGGCLIGLTGISEYIRAGGIEHVAQGVVVGEPDGPGKGCCVHPDGACTANLTLQECLESDAGAVDWIEGYECTTGGCITTSTTTLSTTTTTSTTITTTVSTGTTTLTTVTTVSTGSTTTTTDSTTTTLTWTTTTTTTVSTTTTTIAPLLLETCDDTADWTAINNTYLTSVSGEVDDAIQCEEGPLGYIPEAITASDYDPPKDLSAYTRLRFYAKAVGVTDSDTLTIAINLMEGEEGVDYGSTVSIDVDRADFGDWIQYTEVFNIRAGTNYRDAVTRIRVAASGGQWASDEIFQVDHIEALGPP